MNFFDIHLHFFSSGDVPIQTFMSRPISMLIPFADKQIPFTQIDDNLRNFLETLESETVEIANTFLDGINECAETLASFPSFNHPGITQEDTLVITPLTLYFDNEKASRKKITTQLKNLQEAIQLSKVVGNWGAIKILPFLGIGPKDNWTRDCNPIPTTWDTAKNMIHKVSPITLSGLRSIPNGTMIGVKVYPPLGADVTSSAAMEIWRICEERQIPITVHSGKLGYIGKGLSARDAARLSRPSNWETILERYPNLKVNFAHLGGLKNKRVNEIITLMQKYKNVFSDISFYLEDEEKMFNTIRRLHGISISQNETCGDRLLFGTDFYMSHIATNNYSHLVLPLVERMKRANLMHLFKKMCTTTPERFLCKSQ